MDRNAQTANIPLGAVRPVLVAVLLTSIAFAGCLDGGITEWFAGEEPDADTLALLEELSNFPEWRIEVDGHNDMRAILYTDWMPITTGHIITITERDFYDGTIYHRVIDDFVIQGGDSSCASDGQETRCTGEGGSGPNGRPNEIPLEIYPGLDFGTGAIGLARLTNDTGDSQYFITEKPALHLSRPERSSAGAAFGAYALFAQLFEGEDTLRAIAHVPTNANDQPLDDVVVYDIQVLNPPTDADLLNLIPDVHPDLATQGYEGILETSRILVTEHETTIRFTTATPQEDGPPAELPVDNPVNDTLPNGTAPPTDEQEFVADCNIVDFVLQTPDGTRTVLPWNKNAVDPCTFEHELTFDAAGTYVIDLGVDEVEIEVLPWHDAYLPYTGRSMSS